jgi:hypothetical protein
MTRVFRKFGIGNFFSKRNPIDFLSVLGTVNSDAWGVRDIYIFEEIINSNFTN